MKHFISFAFSFIFLQFHLSASIAVDASQCTNSSSLQKFLNKAGRQKDKTLIIDGCEGIIYSDTLIFSDGEIHIEGINDAVIDFSSTVFIKGTLLEKIRSFMQETGHWMLQDYDKEMSKRLKNSGGIILRNCKNSSIKNIKVQNAQYSGIDIEECRNITIENVESCYNHYQGFTVKAYSHSKNAPSTFSENITLKNCYAHGNWDDFTLGEEGDGFFISTNTRNILLEDCLAECNSDHGFDNCNALGNITYRRCVARYNGFSEEQVLSGEADYTLQNIKCVNSNKKEPGRWDAGSDGGGFQPAFWGTSTGKRIMQGEMREKTEDFLEPFYFYDCVAYKNYGYGFSRSGAPNPLNFEACYSLDNGFDSYKLNVNKDDGNFFQAKGITINNTLIDCFERQTFAGGSYGRNYDNSSLYPVNSPVKKCSLDEKSILEKAGCNFEFESPIQPVLEQNNGVSLKKTAFVFSEEVSGIKDYKGAQSVNNLKIESDWGDDVELYVTAEAVSREIHSCSLMFSKEKTGCITLVLKKDGILTFQYRGLKENPLNAISLKDQQENVYFIRKDISSKDSKTFKKLNLKAGTYTFEVCGARIYSIMFQPE